MCIESICSEVEVLDSHSDIEELREDLPSLKEFPEVLHGDTSDGVMSNFFLYLILYVDFYLLLNVIHRYANYLQLSPSKNLE